jgi:signal transduction histidine kinase
MIEYIKSGNHNKKSKIIAEKEIDVLPDLLTENPNPVFCINNKHMIVYTNSPGEKVLQKLRLKGEKIPVKLIDTVTNLIKKKSDNLMTLELNIGASVYEFSIIKTKGGNCYNIYGIDITGKKDSEKSKQKTYNDTMLFNDRNYIARELHDTVTQTLFSANLIAEVIPKLWKKDPEAVINRLNEIRLLNSAALTEMRALLFDLRPSSFKNEDLGEHLKELVKSIGIKSRIPISVEIIKKYSYSHNVELGFYRIAQETLNNIIKHSCATKASLVIKSLPGKITMTIDDNGVGFNPETASPENLGLIIMKERAKMIGASLDLNSNPGKGTKISVVYNNNNNNKKNKKNNYE